MESYKIFIVEDDPWYGEMLGYQLALNPDYLVTRFTTGKECLANMHKLPDLVTLDFSLPDYTGDLLFNKIRQVNDSVPVVVISGQDDITIAIKMLKMGIADYLVKNDNTTQLLWNAVIKVRETSKLKKEVATLRQELGQKFSFNKNIKGQSPALNKIFVLMDGIKTVSIIRQKVSKSLPVIALTSSVIKGDKKKYLEAGMNDYLRKPFKEKVLMDMMALWLNKSKRPLLKSEPEHVSPTAQLYNLSNIKMIGFGNDGFVAKMVKIFVEHTPGQVAIMEEKYLQGNYKAMGEIAHKIIPSINHLGIISLKMQIREIEKKGRLEINDGTIPFLLATVKTTISQVMDLLKKEYPS